MEDPLQNKKHQLVTSNWGSYSKKKQTILNCLYYNDYPMNCKEISQITKLNSNTVRSYLNQLVKKGDIVRVYRGFFCINPTLGVGNIELFTKVHNLLLIVEGVSVEHAEFEEVVADLKISVTFGKKRKKISCIITGKEEGLSYTECFLAIEYFKNMVFRKIGFILDNSQILAKNIELNTDFDKIKLDGFQCVTVENFLGHLERWYNKGEGLRREVKVAQPIELDTLVALFRGGISQSNIVQSIFLLVQEVRANTEGNRHIIELLRELLKAR